MDPIRVEVELWSYQGAERRRQSSIRLERAVRDAGGEIHRRASIPDIAYEAALVDLPAAEVLRLRQRGPSPLAFCDDVMRVLPQSTAEFPTAVDGANRPSSLVFAPYENDPGPNVTSALGLGHRKVIKPDIFMPGGREHLSTVSAGHGLRVRQAPPGRIYGLKAAIPDAGGRLDQEGLTAGTSAATALATRDAHRLFDALMDDENGAILEGVEPEYPAGSPGRQRRRQPSAGAAVGQVRAARVAVSRPLQRQRGRGVRRRRAHAVPRVLSRTSRPARSGDQVRFGGDCRSRGERSRVPRNPTAPRNPTPSIMQ